MGATCSVTVVYEPSALAAGDEEASLTATAGGVTAAAGLSGTPATPAALSVSPAPYDFGAVGRLRSREILPIASFPIWCPRAIPM